MVEGIHFKISSLPDTKHVHHRSKEMKNEEKERNGNKKRKKKNNKKGITSEFKKVRVNDVTTEPDEKEKKEKIDVFI